MRDHLVTGISWVSFPSEASFKWWLITTHGERKLVFQCEDGKLLTLPLGERDAEGILRLIGEAISHPELQRAVV